MIWLFYFFIFLLPFQDHYLINYEIAGSFTALKLLGGVLLLYALAYSLFRGLPRFWRTAQAKAFLLFAFLVFLSLLFSVGGLFQNRAWHNYEAVSFMVSALTLFFILMTVVDRKERLRRTMLATVASIGVAGVYIIRGWMGGDTEPGWPFGDANYFALYAVSAIPIGLAIAQAETRKLFRWAAYVSVGLCICGLAICRSRAGFIAFAVFALFYVVRQKRLSHSVILVAFLLASSFMLPSAIERLTNPTKWDKVAVITRQIVWRAAIEMTLDHPLFGVGPGNAWFLAKLPGYAPVYHIAHNSFLEISAQSGIPALLAYLLLLFFSWRSARQSERDFDARGNSYLANLSQGLQGSFLAFGIAANFISAEFLRFGWFLIFLTILLRDHRFLPETEAEPSQATSGGAKTHFPPPSRTAFLSKFQGKAISRRPATPATRVQRRPTRTRKSKRRDYIVG